jgi:DnaJ-class molecular chaperone
MDINKLMQLTAQYQNHSTVNNHTNPLFEDFQDDSETRKTINFMEDLMDGTIQVSFIDLFHAPWNFSPQ